MSAQTTERVTMADLRQACQDRGLTIPNRPKRGELIGLLAEYEAKEQAKAAEQPQAAAPAKAKKAPMGPTNYRRVHGGVSDAELVAAAREALGDRLAGVTDEAIVEAMGWAYTPSERHPQGDREAGGGAGVKISTCSYAGWHPSYGVPVRITLGRPRQPEPTGRRQWVYLNELSPRPWHMKSSRFDEHYTAQLDRLAADIVLKLTWLSEQFGPLCLLCFERRVRETSPAECHRLLAARRIERWLGIEVPEMDRR